MATGIAGIAAIATILFPLLVSLQPSAKAGEGLPQIDISGLEAGTFIRVPLMQNRWREEFLIMMDYDSSVYVYALPMMDDKVLMPDVEWWRAGGFCSNFGPELDGTRIKPDGVFRCHDEGWGAGQMPEWRWTYKGENLGSHTPDLVVPKFRIEAHYVVLGRE